MINLHYLLSAIVVGVAGGLGSVLRHALRNLQGWLPWGTLLANLAASALAAAVFVLLTPNTVGSVALVAGLAGGLSTFSAYIGQLHAMLKQQMWLRAASYTLLTFGVSSTVVFMVATFG